MSDNNDIKAIQRFLANKSSYTEAERIVAYLNQHEELLEELIPFSDIPAQTTITLEEKEQILKKIIKRSPARILILKRMVAAAVIAIILSSVIFFYSRSNKPKGAPVASIETISKKIHNTTTAILRVILPDSSAVTLKPGAEIVYNEIFIDKRDIFLTKGSVFFEVQKDVKRPFSVYAKGIKTTALGTSFWVESPVNTQSVEVKLEIGKVVLSSTEKLFTMDSVSLIPGQGCIVNKTTGDVKVYSIKAQSASGNSSEKQKSTKEDKKALLWTNESMQFSKANMNSVLNRIESRYGVKIIAEDGLIIDRSVFTGKIFYSDKLKNVIKSISDIYNMNYEIRNDSVFLKRK